MNYFITKEQLEQYARIYNTFCTVSTKGEDTMAMAASLQNMKLLFEQISQQEETITEKE